MSAPTNAAAKADTKRGRSSENELTGPDSTDRSVRQRIEPSAVLSVPAPSFTADSTAASLAAVTLARPSFMRLAVVERQLIMQGLDLASLARLASTCRQLRAEALHREAGKFIPQPPLGSALRHACRVDQVHSTHASPLFRAHMPMSLSFFDAIKDSASIELLLDHAALFSRVTTLFAPNADPWTGAQLLRLLSLPCIQHAEAMLSIGSMWLENPHVQTALFRLPHLKLLDMSAGPTTTLLSGAVALALKMDSMTIDVRADPPASLRALRALSLSPALDSLDIHFYGLAAFVPLAEPTLTELMWCLPPALTHLSLLGLSVPRNLPRPQAKALFSRVPLLKSLVLNGFIQTSQRGLLGVGLPVLPMLRQLRFRDLAPSDFSFDRDPDPIPPLMRRFLRRFPQVTVQLDVLAETWENPEHMSAILVRYLRWPRIELYWVETEERIGEPPSPHASDDEEDRK